MKSIVASIAAICTLMVGDGLQQIAVADSSGTAIVPTVDLPAPEFFGENAGRGGQAARIEFDDVELDRAMSTWYRLAYLQGGTRLQVFEHYAVSTLGADSDMLRSENVAWNVAIQVVRAVNGSTTSTSLPSGAHVRTGNNIGPSAGLMFALAFIDLLTPGALAGDLRVAGTGGIAIDGFAFHVTGIDVKVATAMLTRPDVIFTTEQPTLIDNVTIIQSDSIRVPTVGRTVAEVLNTSGYEQAGRVAAGHPGSVAVVVVHELRQALAWLCGRTGIADTCAVADGPASTVLRA